MVRVHYIGYPSSMDEWRNCSREEEKIMKLKQRLLVEISQRIWLKSIILATQVAWTSGEIVVEKRRKS